MKRFLALLLIPFLLLPLASCSSSLAVEETEPSQESKTTAEPVKETAPKEEALPTGPITLPEGFSVGYSRVDITPISWPTLSYNGGFAKSANDPLQMTCVALSDGEKVALICTIDMRSMPPALIESTKEMMTKNLDIEIPFDNIFINCSHSHSAVDCAYDDPSVVKWKSQVFYKQVPKLALLALHDLAPAEAYSGKSHTEGLTFVRRYIREDGSFTGIHYKDTSSSPIARHETESDTEMRTLRFAREGKKDVLMVNYQTHYGSASSLYPDQISADFVHTFREKAEKDLDCHFAYCSGAGGNLVFNTRISGERKYPTFVDATPYMVDVARTAIEGEEKIKTGKIQVAANQYEGIHRTYDAELIRKAQDINAAGARTQEQEDLINKYGFHSRYHAAGIVNASSATSTKLPLVAITCGDMAFCAFPYEMFDTNGKETRDGSPFSTTFILSLTGGSFGYIPSAVAFPNGGYEVYSCRFREGTGEELVAEMHRLLGICKNAA